MQTSQKSRSSSQRTRKPLILLATSSLTDARLAAITGDTAISYADQATAAAIASAGGLPLYVPCSKLVAKADIEAYLSLADGLVLPGANSMVNPKLYGEPRLHSEERVDDVRDHTETHLVRLAYRCNVPIFGICKGMQLINVALGGTLYQDVTKQHYRASDHNISGKRTQVTHEADVIDGSLLHDIFRANTIGLNGGHRQAVKQLSHKLRAVAVAKDGIVEAYEGKRQGFLLGIQFHAELLGSSIPHAAIFHRFIEAAKIYAVH